MELQPFIDDLARLSITAGMNQRIHQQHWTNWSNYDFWVKVAVAVTAAVAFGVTIAAAYKAREPGEKAPSLWDRCSMFFGFIALGAAIVLNVGSPEHSAMDHADLFRRWSDLRRDVDSLHYKVEHSSEVTPDDVDRYRELLARKTDINALEKVEKEDRLEEALQAEERARGLRDKDDKEPTSKVPEPAKVATSE